MFYKEYNKFKVLQECKRKDLDSEIVLPLMEVPYEWTGSSFLFDFDALPPETLAKYISYLFKQQGFHLNEGTLSDGIYLNLCGNNRFPRSIYKYRVRIFSNDNKTYLETNRVFKGWYMAINKFLYGEYYLDYGLNKLAEEIKYLKPSIIGYLICDNCGNYMELSEGESPEDYDKKCECGGNLKYIHNIEQPDSERVFNYKKYEIIEKLNLTRLGILAVLIIYGTALVLNVFTLALTGTTLIAVFILIYIVHTIIR